MFSDAWMGLQMRLSAENIGLAEVPNLVDVTWEADGRPPEPAGALHVHPTEYAGQCCLTLSKN